ncbi:hypothetical protein ACLQ2P_15615 [Actinomadura citrea]|uniref:hypothetical protein n=1 Tax=Actinomadura citrea TaxID=46158 RepID=UPI002E2D0F11|nr:hypothetical protein [Actinomadura citrea]
MPMSVNKRRVCGAALALATTAGLLTATQSPALANGFWNFSTTGAQASGDTQRRSDGIFSPGCVRDTLADGHAAKLEYAVRWIGDSDLYLGADVSATGGVWTIKCLENIPTYGNVNKIYARIGVTEKGSWVHKTGWKVIWSRSSGGTG